MSGGYLPMRSPGWAQIEGDSPTLRALGLMEEIALSRGVPGLKVEKQAYSQPLLIPHLS